MPMLFESDAPCPENSLLHCRVAWIAYVRPVFMLALLIFVALGAQRYMPQWALPVWGAAAVACAGLIYHICLLRTVCLYADETGVWLYRGLLPWRRGAMVIKWRDMEDAAFVSGFVGWLLNANTVRVGNRFDHRHDLVMPLARNGREVATQLNALHSRFCPAGNRADTAPGSPQASR